jgi:SAM-dependent methyltransferase
MLQKTYQFLKRKVRGVLLKGTNNLCPICNGQFSLFLPYGEPKRNNACCPSCESLERHRMMWLFCQKRNLFAGKLSLLHVSPEKVFFKKFIQNPTVDYTPIDKFTEGYSYPAGTQNVDLTSMPYPDEKFDAVLCVHVLEHIPDDHIAMREIYRVLKSNGWAIIQVPLDKNRKETYEDFSITDPKEREKAFGQFDHVRWYGLDYKNRLEAAGFEVDVIDFTGTFSPEEQFRYGLPLDDDIYFCKKK